MIRYEEIEPHLIDFLQGNVAEEVEYRVRAYLQQNPDFQQELDELEETLEFTQSLPLVQPPPELKMNFYAMLNQHKAEEARPSLRERLRHFLNAQFYWQTLSVGVLTVLLLVAGYWSMTLFRERFKTTEVALSNLEFEEKTNPNVVIEIPKPKQRPALPAKKEEENAVQGRDEDDNLLTLERAMKPQLFELQEAKNSPKQDNVSNLVAANTFAFADNKRDGLVEINNPNGNISLRSYEGKDIKVESVPAQGFVGKVSDNFVSIQSTQNPQIDLEVLLPAAQTIQLAVTAKQNISFDMDGVRLASNSELTSELGNVEVKVTNEPQVNIYAMARTVENDFDDADAKEKEINTAQDLVTKNESEKLNDGAKEKARSKKMERANRKEAKARARNADEGNVQSANTGIAEKNKQLDIAPSAPNVKQNAPQSLPQNTIVPAVIGGKSLRVNSPKGKITIKKTR